MTIVRQQQVSVEQHPITIAPRVVFDVRFSTVKTGIPARTIAITGELGGQ